MRTCIDYTISPTTLTIVRGCLDTALELDKDGFGPHQGESIVEILQRDIITFCAYLAKCDGEVDTEEIDFINKFFLQELEKAQIEALVRNREIEDESWLLRPAKSFDYFLKPKLLNTPEAKGKYYNIINVYYKAFDKVGHEVISCNRDLNEVQLVRITDYLCMLREFIKNGQFVYQEEKKERIEEKVSINTDTEVVQLEKGSLDKLLEEMNGFIGMDTVKQEVHKLISFIKINKLRKENGLKVQEFSNHMVFLGNPGTGKTTFARLLAKIYYALDIAETDKFIEIDRSGLIAGYVGQTSQKVQEVIENAKGGVLFIDEAYALSNNGGEADFGREALICLQRRWRIIETSLL
ncbi:AAA family ATPase [Anaerosacchariphilus polymeriproducens]|uniref:AAA family ATPase n=1 Tax=Anaerosacchariphilus polymeriproducens TaxID=1812858 RepID=A0A371ASH1_9FIRM|nr:AAA family ATPase [Anaerosacchariphilus polymeriproducens]RDU22514.1 AAA family ATPase [Anaerosacchariphilus polymeriproducens]